MENSPVPTVDISVILATRNRAESLKQTLESLLAQETGGAFTYEVLVIDNRSTDHTRQVVEEIARRSPVAVRYLYEGGEGKPRAVNAGMAQARGAWFAFTDDDVLMNPSCLRAMWSCLTEERADGVTGRILPLWTGARPAWLTDEVFWRLGWAGCIDHGTRRKRALTLRGRDCRWVGGNLAIRREVIERVGGFDVRLLRGEDGELYERCMNAGLAVWYEPGALAYHQLGAERLTIPYIRAWHHRTGYYCAHLIPWKPSHLLTIMPLWRCRQTLARLLAWIQTIVQRRPWGERFFWEMKLHEEAGVWWHRLQRWPRWWGIVISGALADRRHRPVSW